MFDGEHLPSAAGAFRLQVVSCERCIIMLSAPVEMEHDYGQLDTDRGAGFAGVTLDYALGWVALPIAPARGKSTRRGEAYCEKSKDRVRRLGFRSILRKEENGCTLAAKVAEPRVGDEQSVMFGRTIRDTREWISPVGSGSHCRIVLPCNVPDIDMIRSTKIIQFREVSPRARDAVLVARVCEGDIGAFEELFRAYWSPLCSFAHGYLRSMDDAEETVQTVFARIWRNRGSWQVAGTVQDYVFFATRNACLDRLNRDKVVRQWGRRRIDELRSSPLSGPRTESLVHSAEIAAAVARAFAAMPAKRRQICELRLTSGLSYAEIALRLQISTKTVETQISRGLKFLRAQLAVFRG
jgi:RNA polymerase sigma-70 factor (ECF subfamily)